MEIRSTSDKAYMKCLIKTIDSVFSSLVVKCAMTNQSLMKFDEARDNFLELSLIKPFLNVKNK